MAEEKQQPMPEGQPSPQEPNNMQKPAAPATGGEQPVQPGAQAPKEPVAQTQSQNASQDDDGDLTKATNPLEAASRPPQTKQAPEQVVQEPQQQTADTPKQNTQPAQQQQQQQKTAEKQVPKKQKQKRRIRKIGLGFYIGCLGFIVFLFVILVSLLVFLGGVDPTLFDAFDIPVEQVPGILSLIVNVVFGIFSAILFIGLLASLLQLAFLKKEEKDRKKGLMTSGIVSLVILILVMPFWFLVSSSIKIAQPTQFLPSVQVYYKDVDEQFKPLVNPTGLTAPIEIQFSAAGAKTQYPEYDIISYQWDLDGDGEYTEGKTGEEVVWIYRDKGDRNGIFDITLKMIGEGRADARMVNPGERAELFAETSISIEKVKPVIIATTYPEELEGPAPFQVEIDATKSYDPDSEEVSFAWNFDEDGDDLFNDDNKARSKYTYKEPGDYLIQLRLTDAEGNFTVEEFPLKVLAELDTRPRAEIIASPSRGVAPLKVAFDGTNSSVVGLGKIVRYLWNFGDGAIQEGAILSHTYARGGTYDVELTVTDDKGQISKTQETIIVEGESFPPEIVLYADPEIEFNTLTKEQILEGQAPFTVAFDASNTKDADQDIIAYEWDFDGDGTFDETGERAEHTYNQAGLFLTRLQVRDSAGNREEVIIKTRVTEEELVANISATPSSGFVPLRVTFDGSGSRYTKGAIEGYIWDFGDGTPPQNEGAQVTYSYKTVGTYTVKLTVLTEDGRDATATRRIIVRKIPLKASFAPSVKAGQAPLSVSFDPRESTGSIQQYYWEFGDGDTSTERSPTHVFRNEGSFEVVLRVIDKDGLEDEYTMDIEVF